MKWNKFDIDVEPTETCKVWEWAKIKANYKCPGVYVLKDLEGEVLYVGEAGSGLKTLGERIERHIRGWSVLGTQRGIQRYIFEVEIYKLQNVPIEKFKKDILEGWLKMKYEPIFCKDSYYYSSEDAGEYHDPSNNHRKWGNWPAEYQDELKKAKLLK